MQQSSKETSTKQPNTNQIQSTQQKENAPTQEKETHRLKKKQRKKKQINQLKILSQVNLLVLMLQLKHHNISQVTMTQLLHKNELIQINHPKHKINDATIYCRT